MSHHSIPGYDDENDTNDDDDANETAGTATLSVDRQHDCSHRKDRSHHDEPDAHRWRQGAS